MRRAWAWALAVVVVAGGCQDEERAPPEDGLIPSPPSLQAAEAGRIEVVTLTEEQVSRLGIQTVLVAPERVEYAIGLPGTALPAPDFYAEVSAPISGRIVRILAHEGEDVARGELLAELESLELANLVAEVLQARAEQTYQEQQVIRAEALVEKKIMPASSLDKARADMARAEALLSAAHARLHAIGITDEDLEDWATSEDRRPLMEVRAPLTGVLAEHLIELGQSVTAYETMMTIIDPARVQIRGFLSPEDADAVRPGDPVRIRSQAYSGRAIEAPVGTISPGLAAGNRSVTLNIFVDTENGWPIPGESVRLEIRASTGEPVIALPLAAVEYEGQRATVFVERDASHWEKRTVVVTRVTEDAVFVAEGVTEGERVAITQVFTLKALARFEQYGESEESG
jgi:cobalt-zinc-cadmium efflux system membrane fusion protein